MCHAQLSLSRPLCPFFRIRRLRLDPRPWMPDGQCRCVGFPDTACMPQRYHRRPLLRGSAHSALPRVPSGCGAGETTAKRAVTEGREATGGRGPQPHRGTPAGPSSSAETTVLKSARGTADLPGAVPSAYNGTWLGAWLSLVRAPGSGPGGRWFKSTRPDQSSLPPFCTVLRLPAGSSDLRNPFPCSIAPRPPRRAAGGMNRRGLPLHLYALVSWRGPLPGVF